MEVLSDCTESKEAVVPIFEIICSKTHYKGMDYYKLACRWTSPLRPNLEMYQFTKALMN